MQRCQSTAMMSYRNYPEAEKIRTRGDATSVEKKMKRYNLALPEDLFDELQRMADSQQITVVELLRKYIKLGLLVNRALESPDSSLLIRERDVEKEIILI